MIPEVNTRIAYRSGHIVLQSNDRHRRCLTVGIYHTWVRSIDTNLDLILEIVLFLFITGILLRLFKIGIQTRRNLSTRIITSNKLNSIIIRCIWSANKTLKLRLWFVNLSLTYTVLLWLKLQNSLFLKKTCPARGAVNFFFILLYEHFE